MNTLRLENINLHAPYKVMQDPVRHNNFYFVSDSGARFDIDFIINESIIPSGAYEFGITNRRHERSPLNPTISDTRLSPSTMKELASIEGSCKCHACHRESSLQWNS